MARFRYVAMDSKGAETEGVLDAEGQAQAVAMIRAKGFFPTRVVEIGAGGGAKKTGAVKTAAVQASVGRGMGVELKLPKIFSPKVKAQSLMIFTRQLATLIDAGLPLLRGLRILLKQEKNQALRDALNGMGEAVESGSTFSEALSLYPRIFDRLYISMVKAGEAGGMLEVVLSRLAEFMEKAEKIKNKVKSAMIYPVVVLVAAMGILAFLLINVIPKFEEIFKDLLEGKPLPALTSFVIGVSRLVSSKGILVLIAIGGLVVLFQLWGKTRKGRFVIDRIKLKIPIFGTLVLKSSIARLTRTLGTLLTSGVSVLQALNIVKETSGNEVIADAIQNVHDSVKEGDNMALPFESSGVFPGMVVSMIDVGEETGALPEMLVRIAENYDDEVDTAVEGLTSVIEPILIIFLALIIGVIVIAMFVPLISIIGELGK